MLDLLQQLLWGWHVLGLILAVGVLLSLQTGFFQIRRFFFWMKTSLRGPKAQGGVSQFQALTAALAGSIGTGNIVGVAAAITVGGAGSIFWMWVSALLGMMTVFAENLLASKYKNAPGPLGYIEKVKKIGKHLARIYAAGCFLSCMGMGSLVQANAAASAMGELGVPAVVCAGAMAVLLFFVAKGGLCFAVRLTEKLVPLMTVLFFAASLGVLWVFRENIPAAFSAIFDGAFSLKAGAGGVSAMLLAAKTGISRGVFTNEAGLGSASFAYDGVKNRSPVQIGCMGIFQVFVDTILMCTVTGLCILCSNAPGLSGAQLTFYAYHAALGDFGNKAVSLCTALFAFATMITWCCYGREGLFYLTRGKGNIPFAVLYAAVSALGCFLPLTAAFQLGDAFNGLMAIPNLLALFYFAGEVVQACRAPQACAGRRARITFHKKRAAAKKI